MTSRGAHRAPLVRATRVLQHVAAGLATLLVVGVLGVVGARVSAPDGVAVRVGSEFVTAVVRPSRLRLVSVVSDE